MLHLNYVYYIRFQIAYTLDGITSAENDGNSQGRGMGPGPNLPKK